LASFAKKAAPLPGVLDEVYDVVTGQMAPGHFGWKAHSPNLTRQTAEAFLGDLGVTTPLFPEAKCAPVKNGSALCAASPLENPKAGG